jgi:hypothetical protein
VAGAASPAEALDRIDSAHRRFSREPSEDDIAIVAVMRKAAASGEPARRPAASVTAA